MDVIYVLLTLKDYGVFKHALKIKIKFVSFKLPLVDVFPSKKYVIEGEEYILTPIKLKIDVKSNCSLFKSCKKTKYASQVSAMKNAIGFTSFQGAQAYVKQPVYVEFEYTNNEGIMDEFENCNIDMTGKTKFHGYDYNGPCECNSCEDKCVYETSSKNISILNGLSIVRILYIYFWVIVITVALLLYKGYSHLNNKRKKSVENSLVEA